MFSIEKLTSLFLASALTATSVSAATMDDRDFNYLGMTGECVETVIKDPSQGPEEISVSIGSGIFPQFEGPMGKITVCRDRAQIAGHLADAETELTEHEVIEHNGDKAHAEKCDIFQFIKLIEKFHRNTLEAVDNYEKTTGKKVGFAPKAP